ncbi:MAG TPA: T9SS type A sorting domain-containing protein, partial [Bacteroidia bacterium]|nr:T9SS type A sorting domain-containing protein [Bacteroidia bacterium]
YQTITAAATPNITLADNGTVAAANVKQGTSNHTLIKISLAVITADATLTGLQATTAGTYASADVTHLKVWYSSNSTLDEYDQVLSTYTTPGTAGTKTFPSFVPQTIEAGTTGYIFITCYIAQAATTTKTISINAITTAQLTFISGTKGGSCSNGGTQTITAKAFANDDISGAVTLPNTDFLPHSTSVWTTTYDNTGGTITGEPSAPPSWTVAPTRTMWFKFTANTTAQSVSTNYYPHSAGEATDTRLAIYSSSNNAYSGELTLIGENERLLYEPGGSDPIGGDFDYVRYLYNTAYDEFAGLTVTGLTVGNTYFICVDGDAGIIPIATNEAPANDACETATDMVLNTLYNIDNTSATNWSNLNVPDASFDLSPSVGTTENLLYFKFRADATDTYYINQGASTCDDLANSGSTYKGTQFLVYDAGIDCNTMPTLVTGYDGTKQLYSSNSSTAARAVPVSMVKGSRYYITIDGGRGDECAFTLRITKTWPYPIELAWFKATCLDSYEKELQWETATEINNDYFTIERSSDGQNYSAIGTVAASGTSPFHHQYNFLDREHLEGTFYYRIAQTNYNGQKETFTPITVDCSKENTDFSMQVNSNLINGNDRIAVSVSGAADKRVLLVLTDIYGRELYSTVVIENSDSYIYNIKPNSDIPAGLYFITASSNDKYVSKKIIVK